MDFPLVQIPSDVMNWFRSVCFPTPFPPTIATLNVSGNNTVTFAMSSCDDKCPCDSSSVTLEFALSVETKLTLLFLLNLSPRFTIPFLVMRKDRTRSIWGPSVSFLSPIAWIFGALPRLGMSALTCKNCGAWTLRKDDDRPTPIDWLRSVLIACSSLFRNKSSKSETDRKFRPRWSSIVLMLNL